MFSLIITIIAIALVTALALATIYYGGAAFKQGQFAARAATVVNQGQQILAAFDLFETAKGRLPNTLSELVPEYLTALPATAQATPSESYLGVPSAYAASVPLGDWQLPAPQVATVAILSGVPLELCKEINQRVRGNNGVLLKAYPDATTQCYGLTVDALNIAVTRDGGTLVAGMGAGNVSLSAPPAATDASSTAWLVAPGAVASSVAVEPPVTLGAPTTAADTADATQNYQTLLINVPANGLSIEAGTDGFIPGTQTDDDTYIRLFYNGAQVADNDDTPNSVPNDVASYLRYDVPAEATGQYELRVGCYGTDPCTFTAGHRVGPVSPMQLTNLFSSEEPLLAFDDTFVFQSSATQGFSLRNASANPWTVTSITVPAGFRLTATDCAGATLAAGTACSGMLAFTPQAAVFYSGNLTVTNSMGNERVLALEGMGLSYTYLVGFQDFNDTALTSLDFGTVTSGLTYSTWVNVKNTSATPLVALQLTLPSDFIVEVDFCTNATLPVGGTCAVRVQYAPQASGSASTPLLVKSGTTVVGVLALTGQAEPAISGVLALARNGHVLTNYDFGSYSIATLQEYNIVADLQVFTLINTTSATVSGFGYTIPNTDGIASFSYDRAGSSCEYTTSLAPGQSCSLTVIYHPSAIATDIQALTVSTQEGPQVTLMLHGRAY